jgi:hypothetical protein
MPGGPFDSSKTRVAPFFDALVEKDPSGRTWLPELVSLPEYGSSTTPSVSGELIDSAWGENERALPAPPSLLAWLVRNLKCPSSMKEGRIRPERRDLIQGDEQRIEEGLRLLEDEPRHRAWYVLEGPSYPDAYLATSDAIVVIEGKRTEAGPTSSTTWMPVRSQMLRHLDAAFDLAGPRALYGFFMVEGPEDGAIPEGWREAALGTLAPDLIEKSLPHRSTRERDLIRDAFLGVTTWQRACRVLGVEKGRLPDEVPR